MKSQLSLNLVNYELLSVALSEWMEKANFMSEWSCSMHQLLGSAIFVKQHMFNRQWQNSTNGGIKIGLRLNHEKKP